MNTLCVRGTQDASRCDDTFSIQRTSCAKARTSKLASKLAVHPAQEVQVERRRDTDRIVIRGDHLYRHL